MVKWFLVQINLMAHPKTRNTLYVEQAKLISQDIYDNDQYHMILQAPETSVHAKPGHFVHMQCNSTIYMRRPMSIMRSTPKNNTIEILYKVHGEGTNALSKKKVGDEIDLIGPIGQPFKIKNYKKYPLLIGGGVGIPPMIFLAEHIKNTTKNLSPLILMGSEIPFPFKIQPSKIMLKEIPADVIASMPLLDDWGIPSRLTSLNDYAGCFNGYVTELANIWLEKLDDDQRQEVEIFSCGPTPMLKAVSELANKYDLPCQVSLEEYMACAVGGCAGCTVLIKTDSGNAMKRVCVDGPVFEAKSVVQFQN
jgi:dihydroorotate dehydrogenase electron transfer subunit